MRPWKTAVIVSCLPVTLTAAAETAEPPRNVVVYLEKGRFGGWPANNGAWSWGDEIVVGFTLGYHKDKLGGHQIDSDRPSVPRFARSLDGGQTWSIEIPSYLDADGKEKPPLDPPGGIDFTQPGFALQVRMAGSNHGYSRFYWSADRGHTWNGPFKLPTFDRKGIFARTDYIVNGPNDLMAFLTAAKEDGREGWPFCARTTDGGKTWQHVSWIGQQPAKDGYAIMPSTVRLSPTELLTMIRRREKQGGTRYWIEAFRSTDNASSWTLINKPTEKNEGNPPSMVKLTDGRLVLTYGHRAKPYGIRARISADNGRIWGPEIVLRDDGASWDLGYPRTVQRSDGKLVTVYYFHDRNQKERYIAATIWSPCRSGL